MELTFMGIAQNKLSKGSTPIFSCMLCDSTPRSVSPSVGWAVGWLVSWSPFLAAAPKGQCPVGHRGEFQDVLRYISLIRSEKMDRGH